MKTLLKILILTFVFSYSLLEKVSAQGDRHTALLTIFSEDGDKFWLIVEGEKINEEPLYKVEKAPAGIPQTRVKIIFKDTEMPSIDRSFFTADSLGNPAHRTYKIKKKANGKYVIRHVATVALETETEYKTVVNDTPTGEVSGNIEEEVNNNTNMDMNVDINDPGMNEEEVNIDIHVDVDGLNTTTKVKVDDKHNNIITPNPNQNEKKPDVNTHVVPGYTGPYGCYQPMNAQTFANAKNSIASKDFEDSKLTIAKQIANTNCLLVSQVKEILMLFSFENSKLEFAKHAYTHTYDKGNYFMVNDVFDFSSSIDDLNEYISSH